MKGNDIIENEPEKSTDTLKALYAKHPHFIKLSKEEIRSLLPEYLLDGKTEMYNDCVDLLVALRREPKDE